MISPDMRMPTELGGRCFGHSFLYVFFSLSADLKRRKLVRSEIIFFSLASTVASRKKGFYKAFNVGEEDSLST